MSRYRFNIRLDALTHPSWHFGDSGDEQRVATLRVGGGLNYTIIRNGGLLGDDDWFLLSAPDSVPEWEGPWLIPKPSASDRRTLNVMFSEGNGILIAFTTSKDALLQPMSPVAAGALPSIRTNGLTTLVSAADVLQDSDGDGWTNVEEARLGLDPQNPDSDGDLWPDGQDGCPDYAERPEDATDENLLILQKAIFATFGLSGSRNLILIDEKSPRLHVQGYAGPILYKRNQNEFPSGMRVNWWVIRKGINEAEVGILDWVGGAGGTRGVYLRRISGEWFVVKLSGGVVIN